MATLDEKKAAARKCIHRVQVAIGKLDTWLNETNKYQADPRLGLSAEAQDALVGDEAYGLLLDELQEAAEKMPPKDWSIWEPVQPEEPKE